MNTIHEPSDKPDLLKAYEAEMKRLEMSEPVAFSIPRLELVCLISAVQLALRHPRFLGPSRAIVEGMIRAMAEHAFTEFPATRAVIERGRIPAYDDPAAPEGQLRSKAEIGQELQELEWLEIHPELPAHFLGVISTVGSTLGWTMRETGAESVSSMIRSILIQGLERAGIRHCKRCGCIEEHACPGGCSWSDGDLCTRCAQVGQVENRQPAAG